MKFRENKVMLTFLVVCSCMWVGCNAQAEGDAAKPSRKQPSNPQEQLLELAFQAASKIPMDPHHKDRARGQAQIVEASLVVDAPTLAEAYAREIHNWRRGVALGQVAFYLADMDQKHSEALLIEAQEAAGEQEGWRKDRILIHVARTRAKLGQRKRAENLADYVAEAEKGKIEGVAAGAMSQKEFEETLAQIQSGVDEDIHFDLKRNLVESALSLHKANYQKQERREPLEKIIRSASEKFPIFLRIDYLRQMAQSAADHKDTSRAGELLQEAQKLVSTVRMPVRFEIRTRAGLAKLRASMGDDAGAIQGADALQGFYNENRPRTLIVDRAELLCRIAEIYQLAQQQDKAAETYRRALDEGASNPNARPRANDLVEICCSMAVHGFAPDQGFVDALEQVHNALGKPW